MKYSMRSFGLTLIVAITVLAASITQAQNRERFGISAKAGGVNAVIGEVTVNRTGQASALLTNSDDLATGDVITTSSQGSVEVLLNPGSYFRVAENSEFQFEDSSLDHLRIKLVKGSAIVEATGVDDMDLNIHVVTAQADFTIMRSGVYRIDVQPDSSELLVRKGRASFGPLSAGVVKGGNKVTIRNGQIARAKMARDEDGFDLWSNQRAELLARANEKLSARTFSGYIAGLSGWDSRYDSRWGVWAFNPRFGYYTFMPYQYGWSSPYGHHYGNYCAVNPWHGRGSGRWNGNNDRPWGGSSGRTGEGSRSGSSGGPSSGVSSPVRSQPALQPSRDAGTGGGRDIHRNRQP